MTCRDGQDSYPHSCTKKGCYLRQYDSALSDAKRRRETEEGSDATLAPHCGPRSPSKQEDGRQREDQGRSRMKSCHCKKHSKDVNGDSDIWEGYVHAEESVESSMEIKQNQVGSEQIVSQEWDGQPRTQICSDLGKECSCIELPEFVRNKSPLLLPTTPCQSCDCFIDEVASETSGQSLVVRHSSIAAVSYEESTSSAEVGDYFNTMQGLVLQLYAMLGKMKETDEEKKGKEPIPRKSTSARKSTYRLPP
uniref:Argininosuccinate synthase n=1 Tax=Lygus hesperus TaxID=30085 RepID=A0A0A9Y5Y2_LYGHE